MPLERRSRFMKSAIGLPSTKVVRTFTGRPRYDEMLATFVSALVACIMNRLLDATVWPSGGQMRTPMLVGTTRAQV